MASLFLIENSYSQNCVRRVSCTYGVRNKNDTINCQRSTAMCQNKRQNGKHLYDKKMNTADSTSGRNTVILPNGPDRKSRSNAHKRNCSKTKAISPRKSEDKTAAAQQLIIKPYDLPMVPGGPNNSAEKNELLPNNKNIYFLDNVSSMNEDMSSDSSENVNENNARSSIQSRSFENETHFNHSVNSISGNNHVSMDLEQSEYLSNVSGTVSQDSNALSFYAAGSELCVDGSSYSSTGGIDFSRLIGNTDLRSLTQGSAQQNRTCLQGQVGSGISGQDQQYLQQDREINLTEPTRLQCPEHAKLTARLQTFIRWPSDIEQTPARLAEAGFYYTGFQDTVRCFACDGGLKNWDPEDDPWIEHARWFPKCLYVRHIKGEEFINLVRMASQESDEEDDYTADGGAASGGVENSNTRADSASSEIIEPSVLESVEAQTAMEMGFSKKDVAMAINDIFKKGKQAFTCQEIAEILLEKERPAETMNSMLAADSSPSVGIMSTTEHAMKENRRLKELLLCIECKSRQRNILFLPCTHCVVCDLCSRDLHICTHCYRKIKDTVRTYMS